MKNRLLFFLLMISGLSQAQTKYIIQADSTLLRKVGGNNELIIENSTKGTTGVLVNYGSGRTRFSKPRINGDTLFVGVDTILGVGSAGATYTFPRSVVESGGVVNLENDTSATAPGYFYGFNSAGRRGYYAGSSIGTASNGITKTGSDYQLGGTLSQATSISGAAFGFQMDNLGSTILRTSSTSPMRFSASNGTDSSFIDIRRFGNTTTYVDIQSIRSGRVGRIVAGGILWGGVGILTTTPGTKVDNITVQGDIFLYDESTSLNRSQRIHLINDAIHIDPSVGNLFIDTLYYTLSTTGKKLMLRDTTTGLVENIDPALLGGGSPAGNFGNLQINRNGAFATPGSDSLGYTTSGGFVVKNGIALSAIGKTLNMYNGVSGNSSATNYITWMDNYGDELIRYYDGGGTTKGGVGIQPSNVQNFLPSAWKFSWNKGGTLQTAGANEMFVIDANADKVSIKTTNFQITTFGAGTLTTDGSGNVTATSDERAKHDIKRLNVGLKEVMKLRPATFVYNNDKSGLVMPGFIAQNVQSAFGGLGVGKDAQGMLTLNTNVVLTALVNGMQEQQKQIEELKREVKRLSHK